MAAPVLTAQQMADFLMNHYSKNVSEKLKNEYRIRSLAHLENIHQPEYVKEVRRLMKSMYRKKK